MTQSYLITNATLINEGQRSQADVYVRSGRIEKIGPDLSSVSAGRTIDAAGCFLIPGMIDDQVHFREPGLTHKACIETESKAAVAGGITSYMEMPNCSPPTLDASRVQAKKDIAAGKSSANYAFYLGASNDNLENIQRINPKDVCGVKIFMGSSTGNMLVDKEDVLEGIFRDCPTLIATHCESDPMIKAEEEKARQKYGEDVPIEEHARIRSEEACYKSSSFAVELAKRYQSHLHVLHITTEKELQLFTPGPLEGKHITAEACVHHLWFSEEDYGRLGTWIKCNPSIKKKQDRDAIRQAVLEDRIDVIATDHAPHTLEEKKGTYFNAPSGLPLVQHALLSLLEQEQQGRWDIERIVHKTAHAPALRYRVRERGFLREGYWADLVLIRPDHKAEVSPLYYQCQWSPFDGYPFHYSIEKTWVSGNLAYENKQVLSDIRGQALEFEPR